MLVITLWNIECNFVIILFLYCNPEQTSEMATSFNKVFNLTSAPVKSEVPNSYRIGAMTTGTQQPIPITLSKRQTSPTARTNSQPINTSELIQTSRLSQHTTHKQTSSHMAYVTQHTQTEHVLLYHTHTCTNSACMKSNNMLSWVSFKYFFISSHMSGESGTKFR